MANHLVYRLLHPTTANRLPCLTTTLIINDFGLMLFEIGQQFLMFFRVADVNLGVQVGDGCRCLPLPE
jgi:hypothetical protein